MKLLYDGDCGFCTKSALFAKSRLAKDLDIITWQSVDDLKKYDLSVNDVTKRAYFIDDENKAIGGSKAIFSVGKLMKNPWRLIAKFLSLPIFSWITETVYKLVAKNRHHMPGSTQSCRIEDHKKDS